MKFNELPKEIRDWLASEQITFLIGDLNNRLGFTEAEEGVVASLIFDLSTRALPPQNFTSELKKALKRKNEVINSVVGEVKGRLLGPIEVALRTKMAVDIKLISELQQTESVDNLGPKKQAPLPISPPEIDQPRQAPAPPPIRQKESKPFVIHQENSPSSEQFNDVNQKTPEKNENSGRVVHYSGPITNVDHEG